MCVSVCVFGCVWVSVSIVKPGFRGVVMVWVGYDNV